VPGEVVVRQPEQIRRPDQHHELNLDEIDGKQDRHDAERKGADDAVLERFLLLALRKTEDEDGEDHRVVSAQQAFERHEQRDGDEISGFDIQQLLILPHAR
jgi:hypothetical protein